MSDLQDQVTHLAKSIEVPLFGARESLQEAINYAYTLIESLTPEQRVGAYTVLHVVLNTVALEMRRLVDTDQMPEV